MNDKERKLLETANYLGIPIVENVGCSGRFTVSDLDKMTIVPVETPEIVAANTEGEIRNIFLKYPENSGERRAALIKWVSLAIKVERLKEALNYCAPNSEEHRATIEKIDEHYLALLQFADTRSAAREVVTMTIYGTKSNWEAKKRYDDICLKDIESTESDEVLWEIVYSDLFNGRARSAALMKLITLYDDSIDLIRVVDFCRPGSFEWYLALIKAAEKATTIAQAIEAYKRGPDTESGVPKSKLDQLCMAELKKSGISKEDICQIHRFTPRNSESERTAFMLIYEQI